MIRSVSQCGLWSPGDPGGPFVGGGGLRSKLCFHNNKKLFALVTVMTLALIEKQ